MYIQKISGASDAYILEAGGETFAVKLTYAPQTPRKNHLSGGQQIYMGCNSAYMYVPYAFIKNNKWVISENPKPKTPGFSRDTSIGMLLNQINRNRKIRIPREEFITLVEPVFSRALVNDAQSFKCSF